MTDSVTRTNYALLLFYVREKYWHHAEEVCLATIQSTDDHMFRVWRALTLDQQGMANDALREYKAVESRRFTAVPALMGMQLIYKRNRDQEGVGQTEAKLDKYGVMEHMGGWVQAAALCWAAGDINTARDLLLKFTDAEAAMAYRDEYTNYGTIRAWVDLLSGRGALLEKAGATFQKMLEAEEAEHAFFEAGDGAGDGFSSTSGTSNKPGSPSGALKWTDLNAALGYVAFLERKTQLAKAQNMLDRLVVLYPNCSVPPLVGKARLLMQAEDWEQAIEVTRRILTRDKDNVEALTLEALYALVKDTRYDAATVRLRRLLEAVKAKEPRNAALLNQFALVFSRVAGNRLDLLNITTQFSELACNLESRNGDILCGLGYQHLYKHDYKTATATFRKAAALTDSLAPLLGATACLMQQNDLEEANKQLTFCNELQPANQRNAELNLLNAQLRWRRRGMEETTAVLRLLDQAAEAVKHDVATHAGSGMEEYVYLNAPVSLAIAHEYLLHCRSEPPDPMFRKTDVVGEKCARHLEFVVQHLPACMEAQLMLAKVLFVTGEVRKAQNLLKTTLIVQEQPLPEAFLLSSQICQYMGDVKLASRALEQALTLDFTLQEQPLYNLLLGTVQGTTGKSAESLESLKRAFDTVRSGATATSSGKPIQPLSVPERVTLHLQLAQAFLRVRDVEAARTTLAEAAAQFRDSSQAGRVAIAQAMLAARTDVDKSIELLRQVPSTSEYYISAHSQLGKLFLTQKHNVTLYIQCFQEMAEAVPTAQSYVELGEAYSTIQEPEQAIAAYEKAKALSPSSSELSVRVGRALVASHDYAKATRYYQEALNADPHLSTVRADLATLLWHLGKVEDARAVITQSPVYEQPASPTAAALEETVATAIERVNLYLLLYKVLRDQPWALPVSAGNNNKGKDGEADDGTGDVAFAALLTARNLQKNLLDHQLRSESAEVVAEQRVVMATICTELGTRCIHNRPTPPPAALLMSDKKLEAAASAALQSAVAVRLTQGKEYLQEAITYDESNERAQLQSALLCRRSGDVDGCEKHCTTLLRMAGGSASAEEAATLLANLYAQQGREEDAVNLFESLLSSTPHHYEALVDFIVLLHHAGHVDNAKPALDRATAAIPQGQRADPGLSYARGLYEHLRSNNAEALRHFNLARLPADNPWCERALVRMTWIYLVPTTQDLWVRGNSNSVASAAAAAASSPKQHQAGSPHLSTRERASISTLASPSVNGGELHDNIRYAEQLLLLLPVQSEQRQVLQAYCTMATQRPEELETAMHLFLECIVAAETGMGKADRDKGNAAATGVNATAKAAPKKAVKDDDDSDDEDMQLLAEMHSAAADMAQRSNASQTATLAFALQCKVVQPTAFLGLAMSLFVSNQETAARNVLGRVLEEAKVPLTPPPVPDKPAPAAMAASPVNGKTANGKSTSNTGPATPAPPPSSPPVTAPAALLTCSEDDTLERAMLLQAYMDVQANQLESARFMLLQVLAANKGCGAAWDALGMLYERQQKHKDASECYQKAWELLQESDPAVGYKLAFNYLRGNEPVKAIDVCKEVLAHHATYPRIEEDVMDVAYSMLRP
jgi:tetratricopeptide repeat protein 21B